MYVSYSRYFVRTLITHVRARIRMHTVLESRVARGSLQTPGKLYQSKKRSFEKSRGSRTFACSSFITPANCSVHHFLVQCASNVRSYAYLFRIPYLACMGTTTRMHSMNSSDAEEVSHFSNLQYFLATELIK